MRGGGEEEHFLKEFIASTKNTVISSFILSVVGSLFGARAESHLSSSQRISSFFSRLSRTSQALLLFVWTFKISFFLGRRVFRREVSALLSGGSAGLVLHTVGPGVSQEVGLYVLKYSAEAVLSDARARRIVPPPALRLSSLFLLYAVFFFYFSCDEGHLKGIVRKVVHRLLGDE